MNRDHDNKLVFTSRCNVFCFSLSQILGLDVHNLVNLAGALAKNKTKGPLNPAMRSLTASSDQEGRGNMSATETPGPWSVAPTDESADAWACSYHSSKFS